MCASKLVGVLFGFEFDKNPFPDHHTYNKADFIGLEDLPIIMTEKDAIKCRNITGNFWYLKIKAKLSEDFWILKDTKFINSLGEVSEEEYFKISTTVTSSQIREGFSSPETISLWSQFSFIKHCVCLLFVIFIYLVILYSSNCCAGSNQIFEMFCTCKPSKIMCSPSFSDL